LTVPLCRATRQAAGNRALSVTQQLAAGRLHARPFLHRRQTGQRKPERFSHGQFVGTERDHLVWCERFTGKKRTNKGNTMPTKVDVKLTFAAIAAMPRGERYTLTPAIAVLPSPVIERRIF
jgi:hypothetical protein